MKLFFLNGPRKGENIELAPPGISIGREEDNDVQLLVAGVSRYHAKITFNGSDWRIQDLGSTNGTKVNGKPIQSPVPLQENDAIAIGDQIFRHPQHPYTQRLIAAIPTRHRKEETP